MIQSFADKPTAKVWAGTPSRRLPLEIQHVARRKLRMLHNAATLDDLRVPPGFRWSDGDAHDVQIVDYH